MKRFLAAALAAFVLVSPVAAASHAGSLADVPYDSIAGEHAIALPGGGGTLTVKGSATVDPAATYAYPQVFAVCNGGSQAGQYPLDMYVGGDGSASLSAGTYAFTGSARWDRDAYGCWLYLYDGSDAAVTWAGTWKVKP